MTATPSDLEPTDPVAIEIEVHLRKMERAGHGKLKIERIGAEIKVSFGSVALRSETCDLGLVRLAGRILDDPKLGPPLMVAMRGRRA